LPRLALLLAALLLAGCAAPPPAPDPGPPDATRPPDASVDVTRPVFVHGHAAFALFILGEEVNFTHADYDASRVFGRTHLHTLPPAGNGHIVHIEANFAGGVPNVTLAEFFAQYNVTFRAGFLRLDTHDAHNGSAWHDDGAQSWRVLVSRWGPPGRLPFQAVEGDPAQVMPRDGDQVLVSYGAQGDAELAREERAVPEPPRAR
jgi:hypothetical protein